MKKNIFSVIVLIAAIAAMLNLNCMTCFYSAIGAFDDRPYVHVAKDSILDFDFESFKRGRKIYVVLNDGRSFKGWYRGLEDIPEEEYAEKYNKCLELLKDEIVLPALGDTISLSFETSGQDEEMIFGGFGHKSIKSTPFEEPDSNKLKAENDGTVKSISFGDGNVIETETIRDLIRKDKIPLLSAIGFSDTLTDKKGYRIKRLIPIDEIEWLKIEENDPPCFEGEGVDPGYSLMSDLMGGLIIWYFFIR